MDDEEPIFTSLKPRILAPQGKQRCKHECEHYKVGQRTPNSVFCKACNVQISRLGCYLKTVGLRCKCCKQRVRLKSTRNSGLK